jgi:hypothetical protein
MGVRAFARKESSRRLVAPPLPLGEGMGVRAFAHKGSLRMIDAPPLPLGEGMGVRAFDSLYTGSHA